MNETRIEALAIALSNMSGGFSDTESRAFKLRNPGLLRSYRPEKKVDEEHYRVFTTMIGGLKALTADLTAKCGGKNQKLAIDSPLRNLLQMFGYKNDSAAHKIILFLRRALQDESITLNTPIGWFAETPVIIEENINA